MKHFAIVCPPFFSHIRAMEAIGEALAARGHAVTFAHEPGFRDLLRSRAVGFHALESDCADGAVIGPAMEQAKHPGGPVNGLRLIHHLSRTTTYLARRLPEALTRLGVDCVIVDQMEPAGAIAAEALRLPYASVISSVLILGDPAIPPPFLGWPHDPSPKGLRRNAGGERVADLVMTEYSRTLRREASRLGVTPRSRIAGWLSPYAQVSQMAPGLDFPRPYPPAHLHYVGTMRLDVTSEPPLDLALDPEKPLVYASFGTLQGWRLGLFKAIAAACRRIGAQSLVTHCGALTPAQAAAIGATVVRDFVPQRQALRQAKVLVTHAGINTVIDALEAGKPMLAIPLALDQPGMAARLDRAGVGILVQPRSATPARLAEALSRLLSDPGYATRAQALGARLTAAGGAERAADIIEAVAATRRPVVAAGTSVVELPDARANISADRRS